MARRSELESAFEDAIDQTRQCIAAGLTTIDGSEARPQLEKFVDELELERGRAIERGSIDREWIRTTVRWLVEWAPESDLTLIAAIGRLARIAPTSMP